MSTQGLLGLDAFLLLSVDVDFNFAFRIIYYDNRTQNTEIKKEKKNINTHVNY